MRGQAGFSLIELLVVVAVVAVTVTVAVPSFSESFARRRVEGVANELSADLQYARAQAVGNNARVSLVTSASGYSISGTTASRTETYKTVVLPSGLSVTQPVTVAYEAQRGILDASVVAAAPIAITVGNTGTAAQMRVSVNLMGRVHMCSPSGVIRGYAVCP